MTNSGFACSKYSQKIFQRSEIETASTTSSMLFIASDSPESQPPMLVIIVEGIQMLRVVVYGHLVQ